MTMGIPFTSLYLALHRFMDTSGKPFPIHFQRMGKNINLKPNVKVQSDEIS